MAELGLSKAGQEARKVLPIEIDQEKRKRKEPSKFDDNRKKSLFQQQARLTEQRLKEG